MTNKIFMVTAKSKIEFCLSKEILPNQNSHCQMTSTCHSWLIWHLDMKIGNQDHHYETKCNILAKTDWMFVSRQTSLFHLNCHFMQCMLL